jgi:hypothetical protein
MHLADWAIVVLDDGRRQFIAIRFELPGLAGTLPYGVINLGPSSTREGKRPIVALTVEGDRAAIGTALAMKFEIPRIL